MRVQVEGQTHPSIVHHGPKQSVDNQAQLKKFSSPGAFEGKAQPKKWFVVVTLDAKARNLMMFAKGLFAISLPASFSLIGLCIVSAFF